MTYVPNPADYQMKRNTQLDRSSEHNGGDEFTAIDQLTREDLILLCKRLMRQCGMVAMMTEDDIRQAFLDRMAHIGLTGKAADALAAMEKRMDRIEGKPMQRQQSMVAVVDTAKPLPENKRMALEHYFKIRGLNND